MMMMTMMKIMVVDICQHREGRGDDDDDDGNGCRHLSTQGR